MLLLLFIVRIDYFMNKQVIRLRIPSARQKLRSIFPDDPRGDIKLIFGKKVFKLQKAYLRLESGFFRKKPASQNSLLEVHEDFQEEHFCNVLKCFYGGTTEIKRSEVIDYYPIIYFLEIDSLLKILREDIISCHQEYNIFHLIQLAHRYNEQTMFQIALRKLEESQYVQLRTEKESLMTCPEELFKLVIKTHNRSKQRHKVGLPYKEIAEIIGEYCQFNGITTYGQHQLKFSLIDKNELNAHQYKEIFLKLVNEQGLIKSLPEMAKTDANNFRSTNSYVVPQGMTESLVTPGTLNRYMTLEMQNTFQKKINEELCAENKRLQEQMQHLKKQVFCNQQCNDNLKSSFTALKGEVQKSTNQEKNNKQEIQELKKLVLKMKSQLDSKGRTINEMKTKLAELSNSKNGAQGKVATVPAQEDYIVESMYMPSHVINQIVKPTKDQKPQNMKKSTTKKTSPSKMPQDDMDEEELEELYFPRISFDQQPKVVPKKYLPRLANFLTEQGFNKKNLQLIYRRCKNYPNVGNQQSLKGIGEGVFLLKTAPDYYLGGYFSSSIQPEYYGYLEDSNAYIFSLTKDKKFRVKHNSKGEALFLNEYNLIAMGQDLVINNDCLEEESECGWPSSYEHLQSLKKGKESISWLIGCQSPFLAQGLQFYKISEQVMEMMI